LSSEIVRLDLFLDPRRTALILGRREYGRTRLIVAGLRWLRDARAFVVADRPDEYGVLSCRPDISVLDWRLIYPKPLFPTKRYALREVYRTAEVGDLLLVDEFNANDNPELVLELAEKLPVWLVLENRPLGTDPLAGVKRHLQFAGLDAKKAEVFAACPVVWVVEKGLYVQQNHRSQLLKLAEPQEMDKLWESAER